MKESFMTLRYSFLITALAIIGSVNAAEHTVSPYYQEGYELCRKKPRNELLIIGLGQTFLQKDPASQPFKEAFANLQLFMRGVKARIEDPKYDRWLGKNTSFFIKTSQCILEASDLAGALQSFGRYLQTAEVKDFLDDFIDHNRPILLLGYQISELSSITPGGNYYKLGRAVGKRILNFLPTYAKGPVLIYTIEERKNLEKLFFGLMSIDDDIKETILGVFNFLRGFQKSLKLFHVNEQEPKHVQLFMTSEIELIEWFSQLLVELIQDFKKKLAQSGGSLSFDPKKIAPEDMEKLGNIVIKCGDELAKLS
jgi:hypothetical protein